MRTQWDEWTQASEGCYVLRTNVTGWTSEQLWQTYIQLTQAEAAFRIQKSDLDLARRARELTGCGFGQGCLLRQRSRQPQEPCFNAPHRAAEPQPDVLRSAKASARYE